MNRLYKGDIVVIPGIDETITGIVRTQDRDQIRIQIGNGTIWLNVNDVIWKGHSISRCAPFTNRGWRKWGRYFLDNPMY